MTEAVGGSLVDLTHKQIHRIMQSEGNVVDPEDRSLGNSQLAVHHRTIAVVQWHRIVQQELPVQQQRDLDRGRNTEHVDIIQIGHVPIQRSSRLGT